MLKFLKIYSVNAGALNLALIGTPSYESVITWSTMIIDAHSTNLLLKSQTTAKLLADVQTELKNQIEICQNIKNLKGWLFHVMSRKEMPCATKQTYSVEAFYS